MKKNKGGKYLFQYMDMFGVVTNFYDNISEVKKKIKKHSLHIDNNYRVFLAHAEVDSFVNFENFEINRDALDLKPQNYIVFKKKMKADHKFSRGETALLGKMLYFLYSRGF